MHIEEFIARLDGAKKTGRGWMAKCPGHADKSPSMTIAQGDDGRILIKCWAGCDVWQMVGALGLELSDLFPERLASDHVPGLARPFPAADVLRALCDELGVIAIITGDIEEKREVSADDMARLRTARRRVETAVDVALGRR